MREKHREPEVPEAVNTTPQMTCFRGEKSVHKMATGKSDDELIQFDNKMRIRTRSGNIIKVDGK